MKESCFWNDKISLIAKRAMIKAYQIRREPLELLTMRKITRAKRQSNTTPKIKTIATMTATTGLGMKLLGNVTREIKFQTFGYTRTTDFPTTTSFSTYHQHSLKCSTSTFSALCQSSCFLCFFTPTFLFALLPRYVA